MAHTDRELDFKEVLPASADVMGSFSSVVEETDLKAALTELVKIRASQLNGCAYCLDLHVRKALDLGIDDRKLGSIAAWEESPLFDRRERVALAWTDALTEVQDGGVTDDLFERARAVFDDRELVALTITVVGINGWNRLWLAFRFEPIPDCREGD